MRLRINKGTVDDTHIVLLEGRFAPENYTQEQLTLDCVYWMNRVFTKKWNVSLYSYVS